MAAKDIFQLYRIATLYYIEGKSQAEISEKENLSCSQVSRMLEKAREAGLVRIEVVLPEMTDDQTLRLFLKSRLELEEVILAPLRGHETDRSEAIAQTAAQNLPKLLKGSHITGVGWGQTLYRTSCLISRRSRDSSTLFVPLIGTYGFDNPCLQINSIVDRLAESQDGKRCFTGLPAYLPKNQQLSEREKESLAQQQNYWNKMDSAVIGIGGRAGIRKLAESDMPTGMSEHLKNADMVGDILSQYFKADGSRMILESDYRIFSCPIQRLKALNRCICLAGGPTKAPAILTAAKEKYFNILITDSLTAQEMYNEIRRTSK